ncbi:MAG TPA: LysR family transcriptional regulator [Gammaproteobacteria bacterium]|nr:LysR family transcriptional regulator [Gammaproteobacteria bacterium]
MLPLAELAVLVAVVEAGSLSGGARTLGTSKAAVSDQIRRLEDRLGARLLQRTTRRIALTEAGRACYAHSVKMVHEAEAAARSALLFHDQPRGTLRIAAPQTFAQLYVVPAVTEFLAAQPGLKVELAVSSEHVDIVAARMDVAVRIGELPDSRLVARRLTVARLVVCGAPQYLSTRGAPLAPADLRGHHTLEFAPLRWRGRWRLQGPDGRRNDVQLDPIFSSDSGEALLAAAVGGLGLAALPDWMAAPALTSGELIQVLPGWSGPLTPIRAVYAGGGGAPAKTRLFVDHLAGYFARRDGDSRYA